MSPKKIPQYHILISTTICCRSHPLKTFAMPNFDPKRKSLRKKVENELTEGTNYRVEPGTGWPVDKRIEAILGTLIGNSVQRQGSVGVQQQIAGAHGVDNRDPGVDNRDPWGR